MESGELKTAGKTITEWSEVPSGKPTQCKHMVTHTQQHQQQPLPSLSPCGAALHFLPTAQGCPFQASCSRVLFGREVEWLVEAKSAALAFASTSKTNKPPFADFLFTEMVGVLSMDQVAILDYLHFSLVHFTSLCSTLPSFLSRSFYS